MEKTRTYLHLFFAAVMILSLTIVSYNYGRITQIHDDQSAFQVLRDANQQLLGSDAKLKEACQQLREADEVLKIQVHRLTKGR